MKILIACEFSGVVRDAFLARGHDAISCDLLPTERPGPHIQGDVPDITLSQYDLMIAHPPCTHLAVSGARWMPGKEAQIQEALEFVQWLMNAPVSRIAIENPVSIIGSRIRECDQLIHPWQYGHNEEKQTCLWLKNLPRLRPSNIVDGREQRVWRMSPSEDRWKERSRTYVGIARAMAAQWGTSVRSYWTEFARMNQRNASTPFAHICPMCYNESHESKKLTGGVKHAPDENFVFANVTNRSADTDTQPYTERKCAMFIISARQRFINPSSEFLTISTHVTSRKEVIL